MKNQNLINCIVSAAFGLIALIVAVVGCLWGASLLLRTINWLSKEWGIGLPYFAQDAQNILLVGILMVMVLLVTVLVRCSLMLFDAQNKTSNAVAHFHDVVVRLLLGDDSTGNVGLAESLQDTQELVRSIESIVSTK